VTIEPGDGAPVGPVGVLSLGVLPAAVLGDGSGALDVAAGCGSAVLLPVQPVTARSVRAAQAAAMRLLLAPVTATG
jgi:hypothetical protein